MNATLPDQNRSRYYKVKNIPVGEYGYLQTWAMAIDLDHSCWLNGDNITHATAFDVFGNELKMAVARNADGYHVWMRPELDHWSPGDVDISSHIPVVALHYWPANPAARKRAWFNWGTR